MANSELEKSITNEELVVKKAEQALDTKDRNALIYFGSEIQEKLDEISSKMIEGVQNKDLGAATESLNQIVSAIRGFDIDALNPNQKQAWWQKVFQSATPLTTFLQGYEKVRDQIDLVSNDLEKHKSTLMRDIVSLDKLYDANLEYFRGLEIYIKVGEEKLSELDNVLIPEALEKSNSNELMEIQDVKELRSYRDELERKIYDLKLSRQVVMQALPSIRLVQENDKSLINKITSTIVNTVPLWRNQLAQTITIFRSHDAAKSIENAADLTNELLEKSAEGLKEANRDIRKQMERGVYDIESIKKANNTLIETLNESLTIAQEGKMARAKALEELTETENKLKNSLLELQSKKENMENENIKKVEE